ELVWGTRTAPENHWITRTRDDGTTVSCAGDEIGLLKGWYLAFFDTNAVKTPCPYTAEFPVSTLQINPDDPDVTKMATDRVIFYGGALQGAQDKLYTPVNDLLPGVFSHAMAMDNLITFNGRPYQNTATFNGRPLDGNLVQVIAVIPVILILSWFDLRTLRRKREERERSVTFEYVFEKTIEKVWHYFAFALALGAGLILTLLSG